MTGRVTWWSRTKGYGFITPLGRSEDVFVHHSGVIGKRGHRDLDRDSLVTFETAVRDGRTIAVDVRPAVLTMPQREQSA